MNDAEGLPFAHRINSSFILADIPGLALAACLPDKLQPFEFTVYKSTFWLVFGVCHFAPSIYKAVPLLCSSFSAKLPSSIHQLEGLCLHNPMNLCFHDQMALCPHHPNGPLSAASNGSLSTPSNVPILALSD